MGAFFAGMGIFITILVFMIWIGEERFNALLNRLRCAHKYKYYNNQGEEDNDNPCVAKCCKCGKKEKIRSRK